MHVLKIEVAVIIPSGRGGERTEITMMAEMADTRVTTITRGGGGERITMVAETVDTGVITTTGSGEVATTNGAANLEKSPIRRRLSRSIRFRNPSI